MNKHDKKLVKQLIDQCAGEVHNLLRKSYNGQDLEDALYYAQDYANSSFDNSNGGIKNAARRAKRLNDQKNQELVDNLPEIDVNSFLPGSGELGNDSV